MKKQFIVLSPKFENGNFAGYNQVDGTQFFCDDGSLYSFVSLDYYNEVHQHLTGQIHTLEDEIRELKLSVTQEKAKQQPNTVVTHTNFDVAQGLVEFGFNKAVKALRSDLCHNNPEIPDWLEENKEELLKK